MRGDKKVKNTIVSGLASDDIPPSQLLQILKFWFANFAFVLFFGLATLSKCTPVFWIVVVLCGVIVDLLRRRFSPELANGGVTRSKNIREALNDMAAKKQFKIKFFCRTASIYWVWWGYFAFVVIPFYIKNHDGLPPGIVLNIIEFLPLKLYPFIHCVGAFRNVFGDKSYAPLGVQYLSMTWDVMIIAMLSEISCGAFYYTPKDIEYVRLRKSQGKSMVTRGMGHAVIVIVGLIILYSYPGLVEVLLRLGNTTAVASSGQEENIYGPVFSTFLVGISLLGAAGAIRYLYLDLLYKVSGGFENLCLQRILA